MLGRGDPPTSYVSHTALALDAPLPEDYPEATSFYYEAPQSIVDELANPIAFDLDAPNLDQEAPGVAYGDPAEASSGDEIDSPEIAPA